MTRERERGYRLAEAALGASPPSATTPEFPSVAPGPKPREPLPAAGLARDLARIRRLPAGRAEAEVAFLEERGWRAG